MTEVYYDGDRLYPNENILKTEHTKRMLQESKTYMKFYANGRCLSFSIASKDSLGNEKFLTNNSLNPNSDYYSKDYYYSNSSNSFLEESFVYGEGSGMYLIFKYSISMDGEIIKKISGKNESIYKKEILLTTWKEYPIDW